MLRVLLEVFNNPEEYLVQWSGGELVVSLRPTPPVPEPALPASPLTNDLPTR